VRVVLDPNILVSALLSRTGAPAQIVARWLAGEFELVASKVLLAELERALAYPKLRERVTADDGAGFVDLLRRSARIGTDRDEPPRRSTDPGDDYLLALAEDERALLVSGDRHLVELADRFPIRTPRAFLEELDAQQ
jgi:uncharacterized protein